MVVNEPCADHALKQPGGVLMRMKFQPVPTGFGAYRVLRLPGEDFLALQHGPTLHGMRGSRPGDEREPFGYYAHSGPFSRLCKTLPASGAELDDVGIIGQGVVSLGCYARSGESWTSMEIDPTVDLRRFV